MSRHASACRKAASSYAPVRFALVLISTVATVRSGRPRRVAAAVIVAMVAALTVVAGTASASAAVSPIAARAATGVTADALPTVQIDGVVWSQAVIGNTVYAGGNFANARPAGAAAGTNLTPRANLLAYNLTTGALITSFAPSLNAQVKVVAASPDGSRLYVGGTFTTANGANRYRIAAYNTSTGALITSFAPSLDSSVNAITATNTTVYVGGSFSNANGVARTRLAAFSAANGALLGWAPTADSGVNALQLTPDGSRVIVAGSFSNINGSAAVGVAALDATTGSLLPYAVNQVVKNYGTNGAILSLSTDGNAIYGSSYAYGNPSNFEGVFSVNPDSGAINWLADCHGDSYGAYGSGGEVYVVSHQHYCANIGGFPDTNPRTRWQRTTAFTTGATGTVLQNGESGAGYGNFAGQPSPSLVNWFPDLPAGSFTGQDQAAWSVTGDTSGKYVVEGGEFPSVNGTAQQGLVRFAVPSIAPDARGPQITGSSIAPTLTAPFNTAVTASWPANSDQDDETLTYSLYRSDAGSKPIYTTTADSEFWNRPTLNYRDNGLSPGTSYTYWVVVSDPSGNSVRSPSTSVTTPTNAPISGTSPTDGYGRAVLVGAPNLYWRLDDAAGSTSATDSSGYGDYGVGSGSSTFGTASPVSGSSGTAATLSSSGGSFASNQSVANPGAFSEELWFNTKSTSGGRLIGFGNNQTGNSTNYDRLVYMLNSGQLTFGVYPGQEVKVTSPKSYNDGGWHFLVASQGPGGMALYVDGALVASDPTTTTAQNYTGYWRVGADSVWDGNNPNFSGAVDEAAVFPTALSAAQVNAQYQASGVAAGGTSSGKPTAAFTSSCTDLTCTLDATASSDTNGAITGYAWNFGDGTSGVGVRPVHPYASAGTYSVTLTVTDDSGATATVTKSVQATAPNQAPIAAFTPTCTGTQCTFDASASSDPDGTVASYAWTFGDNATGSGSTATHTYAAAGQYSVTLTVTDNQGATTSLTKQLNTTSGTSTATYASDAFGRTVSSGLGTADVGGAWTTAPVSAFAVGAGTATVTLAAPGSAPTATLATLSQADSVTTVDLAVNQPATGSTYLTLRSRINGTSYYALKVRFMPSGVVHLALSAVVSGTETVLREVNIPSITYSAGSTLTTRFVVHGSGASTTLSGYVWPAGATPPSSPQVTSTDSTAALQGAGSAGLQGYLSASSTNAPVVLTLDNYSVTSG